MTADGDQLVFDLAAPPLERDPVTGLVVIRDDQPFGEWFKALPTGTPWNEAAE